MLQVVYSFQCPGDTEQLFPKFSNLFVEYWRIRLCQILVKIHLAILEHYVVAGRSRKLLQPILSKILNHPLLTSNTLKSLAFDFVDVLHRLHEGLYRKLVALNQQAY